MEKDYDRQIIDSLECYARGEVHTNGLENFWSLLKRALKGTDVNVTILFTFSDTAMSKRLDSTSVKTMTKTAS